LAIGQMLKPVAMGIESVTRLAIENRQLLAKLTGSGGVTPTLALTAGQTQTFENIAQQLNRGASVESANQKLFDALHAELKGYKDGFLFDALQRPFIRDLINVYDELESQHARAKARVQETANSDPFAAAVAENLQNTLSHLLEIFERLQVVPQCTAVGEPVDKRVHRVVDLRPAARQDQSGLVLHSQRPGFLWRDGRCVRPEEVVASRWVPEGAATGGTTHLPP
ncbi:MAG: nucleotide exchange factor GrpE, partial [Verrucomicrobia bacterium]|nr:nucleotide exchange factor GrpE [Verrucomicrobiota bacterium]